MNKKSNIPPVKIEITEEECGRLQSVLDTALQNGNESEKQAAQKLLDKIDRYARDVTDNEGLTKKRICFFESEAAAVIDFLIRMEKEGN